MANYNMFTDLKTARDLSQYTLFRGTTDFSRLEQFNLFETGYPYLVVVSIPDFLQKMSDADDSIKKLVDSYVHILEYEFTGLDSGLEDITSEQQEISNGIQSIQAITKTNMTNQTFSMQYYEKAGSTLSKMHELYLRSVRDPGSGFKTYNGLITADGSGEFAISADDAGFHKECFSFLYMHTDNTGLLLERAAYIVGAMPTTANLSQYNGKKGEINFSQVSCEFTGFPIQGAAVNKKAKEILDWMNTEASNNPMYVHRNSWDYAYHGTTDSANGLAQKKLSGN